MARILCPVRSGALRSAVQRRPLGSTGVFLVGLGFWAALASCSDRGLTPPDEGSTGSPPPAGVAYDWLETHVIPIPSIGSQDFSDLEFLKEVIEDRRIVLLGEWGQGVAEFNEMKVRLVKFLHQEMGFDVVAFESSLFECSQANRDAMDLTATELLTDCLYPIWHTEEVLPLFEYMKESRSGGHPLTLAGFDMKPSNPRRFRDRTKGFLMEVVTKLDPGLAAEVRDWEAELLVLIHEEYIHGLRGERGDYLYDRYAELHSWFVDHQSDLLALFPGDTERPLLARQMVWTTLNLIEYARAESGGCADDQIRDHGMAVNLDFFANELHKDRKVIVWARNYHIRKANQETREWHQCCTSMQPVTTPGCRTMGGEFTDRGNKAGTFSLGLYAYEGIAADNYGQSYSILPPMPQSLEGHLSQVGGEYLFLDLTAPRDASEPSWLTEGVPARLRGSLYLHMKVRDQYDGVMLIRQVRSPTYLR